MRQDAVSTLVGATHLLQVVHLEGQLLQREQDELQEWSVVGGLGVGQPGVEEPVAANTDEPRQTHTHTHLNQSSIPS